MENINFLRQIYESQRYFICKFIVNFKHVSWKLQDNTDLKSQMSRTLIVVCLFVILVSLLKDFVQQNRLLVNMPM